MPRTKGVQKKQWYKVSTYYQPSITEVEIEKEHAKFVVVNGSMRQKETRDTLYGTDKAELLERMVDRFRTEMDMAEQLYNHKKDKYEAALQCAKENS